MGRKRKLKKEYEDRVIDIDIVFYENYVIESKTLKIPHPYCYKRDFVLIPCLEVIPDWVHPVLKKNLKELYQSLKINKL